jgi:hypothetical protein
MACPYLKEVVMLSCDAFPVKKMLPLDRLATGNPCLGEFHGCPFFQDVVARLTARENETVPADRVVAAVRKDGRR